MDIIRDMARDMRLGAHILLIGNQGVGKNKIADRFLHLIQRPRQYMQLHRDTTVESITMQTNVENGVLRYEDSALVRAAREGHVLVIDEADKAPLHVIAVLKSLLDSGTLLLGDGRRIQPASASVCERSIPLHPEFRIIMLANRPGFPFLDVPDANLLKLMAAFTELREMADEGLLQYPYSTRELVNIVKHINKFPTDSLSTVIKNIFDFDTFSTEAFNTVREVFLKHGIPFGIDHPYERVFLSHRFLIEPPSRIGDCGVRDDVPSVDVRAVQAVITIKECAWQIPMLDVNICSDGLVSGNTLIVATVNPPRLYIIENIDVSNEVYEVDISRMLLSFRQVLKYQPRIKLARYGEHSILIHEEVTNSLCIMDMKKDLIQHMEMECSTSKRLVNMFENKEYRLVRAHNPLLFARSGKEIIRFGNNGILTRIEIHNDITNIFPVDEEKVLVKGKDGDYYLLCCENGRWMIRLVDMNLAVDIDGLYLHDNSVFLSAEGFHYLKSSGFPRLLNKSEVVGSMRNISDVVDARRPHYLSDENTKQFMDFNRNLIVLRDAVVVRAQPKWNVPKDVVADGNVNVHKIGGFLEAVDSISGFVQYVPVAEPSYQSCHGTWLATIARTPFIMVPYNDDRVLTVDTSGGIRLFEFSPSTLGKSYREWTHLVGGAEDNNVRIEFERDLGAFDISKLSDHKLGKFDPFNAPHYGGNQWMGGTGGYSTAGLGGVGGPFRLDAGHDIQQMPESAKRQVPEHILKKAREIAKAEYQKKLKDIAMSEYDDDAYMSVWNKIEKHASHLRSIIEQVEAKRKERQWTRHQTSGDLDDGKLIEVVTGERNIYRRRLDKLPEIGSPLLKPKRMRLCFDVSGSMYRFNGYDKRLRRSLEAALMVMTSFEGNQDKVAYDIVGHSGDGPCIEFITNGHYPKNNKERLDILKQMMAHTQFCSSGDFTVESLDQAIKTLSKENECDERIVVLISDANLDRYGISPKNIVNIMNRDDTVNPFVIFIGSLGQQAERLQSSLPTGKAFVCENASDLPKIMQNIFTSTLR
ncbi:hypothetical protein Angca_006025 [Angiostrongylus cantonensis]|nr:hypothetical protein Angca_006025 [Angiostrongylus cantonensis]